MYDFYYNHIKTTYGERRSYYLQTHFPLLQYITEHLYKDLEKIQIHFDFSDYPTDPFLYDSTNKKVLGKMKDKTMKLRHSSYKECLF